LTELRVVTNYLKLAFWPHPLVFDYGSEILVTGPLAVAPYALIMAAILTGIVIAWRRSPMAGFLGCWFFLILAPTSTVVPIAEQPMAESRMYLPLAAVIVLVTLMSFTLGRRRAFVVLSLVGVGLGALTVRRNHDYHSGLSIWEDTVARHPHTSRGHYNLAFALAKTPGRLPDAIAQYEEALRINPNHVEAHHNLANALATMPGRLPDAIAHYEAALRLKPDFAEVQINLGIALAKMPGRMADAIAHFEEALRLKPTYAEAHYNLASALAAIPGRLPEAIANYEEALRLKPTYAEAHNNLANALAGIPSRLFDAIAHFEEAVRLKPDSAAIHYNFANALAKVPSRMADAIAHYEQAVRLKPDFVEAHSSLAIVYAETGRLDAAIEQLEIAARLDPASATIRDNLGMLKARRK
jgi:tetratricopeptide (TPR) repeat protein